MSILYVVEYILIYTLVYIPNIPNALDAAPLAFSILQN